MDERSESEVQLRNLEFGDQIELFYEDFREGTIRATVNRLTKSDSWNRLRQSSKGAIINDVKRWFVVPE